MIATAGVGDRAEAAVAVATIGNLDIGDGALNRALDTRNERRVDALDAKHLVHDRDDAVLLVGANECGDFGELIRELGTVSRGHAAAHDDASPANALGDLLGERKRGLDALGRRGGEERTRVDNHRISVLG